MSNSLLSGTLLMATILYQQVHANTIELATINLGSAFDTCNSIVASTNDGTEATASCGGQRIVPGFPLPVSMSSQAFASANPLGAGLRVIVDIQNGIDDPAQFNSFVGYTLNIETQDDVTFSAGAFAVFTWGIHEHIVNLDLSNGFITETGAFGFTPVLFDTDVFWDCTRICGGIGTPVPGVGNVVDMNLTRTETTSFTPGQVLHVFDRMSVGGDVSGGGFQANQHVELDFLDPITVTAQVFDAQGNPLTNVTATSALGVNYLGGPGPTGTPEPGTLCLLGLGLLAVAVVRRIAAIEGRKS